MIDPDSAGNTSVTSLKRFISVPEEGRRTEWPLGTAICRIRKGHGAVTTEPENAPVAGTPAAGTPAAGTPAAGTPAAGTPGASPRDEWKNTILAGLANYIDA